MEEFGSALRKLIEDDYSFTNKFSMSTTNPMGIEVSTEGELSEKGPLGSITATCKGPILSLDNLSIHSNGKLNAKASLKTNAVSTFFVSAGDERIEPGKSLQSFGKLGAVFATPSYYVNADVDVVNGPLLHASASYLYKKWRLGGETVINTHLEKNYHVDEKDKSSSAAKFISDLNLGVAYTEPAWSMTVKTIDLLSCLRISYLHTISPKLSVGTQLDYKLKANAQKIILGSEFK